MRPFVHMRFELFNMSARKIAELNRLVCLCFIALSMMISYVDFSMQQGQIHTVFAQPARNSTSGSQSPDEPIQLMPVWVKNNTALWADGRLGDSQFILGIRYIIANNIMPLPHEYANYVLQKPLPSWVKQVAKWWTGNKISDYEFMSNIQYLIINDEIKLGPGKNNSAVQDSNTLENNFPRGKIKIDDITLDVQVADTPDRMTEGLQFQQPLPYNQGMIFVFREPQTVAMWMKDMQFPLDIIWFDSNGYVIHIEKDLPLCAENMPCLVYDGGRQDTKYVLEVTAGFVNRFNVTENSSLFILDNQR